MNRDVTKSSILNIASALSESESFRIAREIVRMVEIEEDYELLLVALERKKFFHKNILPIFDQLLSQTGHYNYLSEHINPILTLNKAVFQSDNLKSIFFHRQQFEAAVSLEEDGRLILSAPTSFGKSLLIEEIVASKKFQNIVIIQPTLALLDETRTKLKRYTNHYKIIFGKTQDLADRNLFLLTQERLVDYPNLPKIDFFIIDEFYKLSSVEDERGSILNHAFYKLIKSTSSFYLLGPSIDSIPPDFESKNSVQFMKSTFKTVATNTTVELSRTFENLEALLNRSSESTLIYCKGAASCETIARKFAETIPDDDFSIAHKDVTSWIGENIHPEWSLPHLLKKGVAFHHGAIPRHIGKYLVNAFNEKKLKYLFCTTTLIEGVNTSAKNVVIWDLMKGDKKVLSSFDIKNISGRAGRMGRHYSGNVYVFGKIPQEEKFNVDIPWFTQDTAPVELLIQMDERDLNPSSRKKVKDAITGSALQTKTLKKNTNISIAGQSSLAAEILADLDVASKLLCWNKVPKWENLEYTCSLIWRHFVRKFTDGVASSKQLAFFVWKYQQRKSLRWIIEDMVKGGDDPDAAVRKCMTQSRNWFEFRFPKLLMTVDEIQKEVLKSKGRLPGDYSFYAGSIENGFVSKGLATLKEIGVPIELSKKLEPLLSKNAKEDSDRAIVEIKRIIDRGNLDAYELFLLRDL